ncbi:MAG: FAD-dependent oxidoreductase, partial [Propionibacteriaceae bacterium]|nr:FAD-dependent oxidoreductase [Propionibacteriaceae bacterium]
ITVLLGWQVLDVSGDVDDLVVHLSNGESDDTLDVHAIVLKIGVEPNVPLLNGELALSDDGYIPVDRYCRSSAPGLYAAGDRVGIESVKVEDMHMRSRRGYSLNRTFAPVDHSVHRTGQCQCDRRAAAEGSVPGRYKGGIGAGFPVGPRQCPTVGTFIEIVRLRRKLC